MSGDAGGGGQVLVHSPPGAQGGVLVDGGGGYKWVPPPKKGGGRQQQQQKKAFLVTREGIDKNKEGGVIERVTAVEKKKVEKKENSGEEVSFVYVILFNVEGFQRSIKTSIILKVKSSIRNI